MPRRLLAVLTLCLAAAVLTACGGDDGAGDEEEIVEVIENSISSTDPADCTDLQTQRFLEQVNFATGDEALEQCEEDVADTENDPDSVSVENVEVDGDAATADATFVGGGFDGSTLTLALVKEDDQWKLDEITEIPTLDLEAFRRSFAEQLPAEGEVPPQVADCIVAAIGKATEDEIKQAILSGDQATLVELFGDCLPSS